ncbi:G-protein alpha subunit-domain-containing protein [Apiosordaria backusii]|uniref:G-protein alpha subunit-domain-containing protein n=1 Tax=Apiosordaria backusii TaxID=314023 RepID=A0AA40E491_9PEZI|nr:G-protein alpha subunit-domain-containing protein [Apiosordaria backusii]
MKSTTSTKTRADTMISEKSGLSDEEDNLKMSATPTTTKVFWQLKHTNAPSHGVIPKRAKRRRARSTGCFGIPFDLLAFLRSMSVFQLDTTHNNTKRIQPSSSPQFESEKIREVKKSTTWPLLHPAKSQAAREARLAAKRSAAIDRQLEQDRDAWCRKAQVMVTSSGRTNYEGKTLFFNQMRKCSLPESYEPIDQITKRATEDPAGKVRNAAMKEIQRILHEMHAQVQVHYERTGKEVEEPLSTLIQTAKDLSEYQLGTLTELPEINDHSLDLVNRITQLWSNPTWTNLCYNTWGRSKPFDDILLSLLTRSFSPNYTPTPTDLSHIRHFSSAHYTIHRECLTPFPNQSSLTLDLLDRDNTSCCSFLSRKIFNFLSPTLSVLMLVDLSSYSHLLWEESGTNYLQESLLIFESIVNSRRFAQEARGAMMLLLWNSEGLEKQLQEGSKPLGNYMKDFKGQRGEENEWIKREFEKVVKRGKYGRDVKIRVGEPGDEGTVRWVVETVKTGLLDQGLCDLGLGREGEGGWYRRR